ncbi:MAG: cytochrome P450 [Limnothrix sp.]
MTTSVKFNPFDAAFHQDPYPTYAALRREDPIHWSFLKAWVITRYDDVNRILKDDRNFVVDDLPERLTSKNKYLASGNLDPLAQTIHKWLFFLEPPDHNRLKNLVFSHFSPKAVEAMRPIVQENVNRLLAKVKHTGKMDVIRDFASPLPALTVAHILGLDPEDHTKLIRWSYELFFVFDQPMSLKGYQRQNEMAIEARHYLLEIIEKKRNNPDAGLLSELVTAEEEENKLTQDEILGFCVMLFIVGQETTKSLISNALTTLIKQPELITQLREKPELIKPAIEELLRYDSPVQVIARLAKTDITIGEKTIKEKDKIILCVGAANRDPEIFPEPNKVDFLRENHRLPFGGGIHFCLGAFLARMQGQIAIEAIANQLQNPQLVSEDLDWRESITLRGLKTLEITFDSTES